MSTDLRDYGPDKPCQRTTACANAGPHLAGVHLDPASDLYDGPETAMAVLPLACRDSAHTLLYTARREGWNRRIVETALHDLTEEILRLKDQVAHVRVDKNRAVRAAMDRAMDCVEHGDEIRRVNEQAHHFGVSAQTNDEQRRAWVETCHQIEGLTRPQANGAPLIDGPAADIIRRLVARAGKEQARIEQRHAKKPAKRPADQTAGGAR